MEGGYLIEGRLSFSCTDSAVGKLRQKKKWRQKEVFHVYLLFKKLREEEECLKLLG